MAMLYAAYELKSEKELCLGVWDSVKEMSFALEMAPEAIYRNLYQTDRGRRFSRSGLAVCRISLES